MRANYDFIFLSLILGQLSKRELKIRVSLRYGCPVGKLNVLQESQRIHKEKGGSSNIFHVLLVFMKIHLCEILKEFIVGIILEKRVR